MFKSLRQRFGILMETLGIAAFVTNNKISRIFAGNSLAVDIQAAAAHFYLIAGQADNAFDEIGLVVLRKLEDHDIAALRHVFPYASVKQRQRKRQRMLGITISIFGNEQIIADIQGRIHRTRRNFERFKQKRAN